MIVLYNLHFVQVQRQVKAWRKEGRGRKMCTARYSWAGLGSEDGREVKMGRAVEMGVAVKVGGAV
jgi:hypothetical protein